MSQQSKDPRAVYYGNTTCTNLVVTMIFFVPLQTGKKESPNMHRPTSETILMCEEAVNNLDVAAERAVQLFSNFANQHPRIETSREHENQSLAKAAEMLVLIAKKIHSAAKMAKSANIGSNGKAEMDISIFNQ